jgi:hypothetical protein
MRTNFNVGVAVFAILGLAACAAEGRRVVGDSDGGDGIDASPRVDAGSPPPTDEECYDGLDNNGDGLIDERCPCVEGERQSCWPGTTSRRRIGACRDGVQVCEPFGEFTGWGACVGSVGPSAEIAGNGIDEDCDGADQGGSSCIAREFGEGCGDGSDEDSDGLVDCADPDCAADPTCSSTCTPSEAGEQCTDGIDNDCDGVVDCLDGDCAIHERCAPPPPPPPGCRPEFPFIVEASCGDGRDNDCDSRIDCDDSDCVRPGSCGCDSRESACSDGMDNDCDGDADCTDLDCQRCTAGSYRFCDDPMYCHWGRQECGSDGRWGTCVEVTTPPPGCSGSLYSATCCVDAGECCQNYPADDSSIGDCSTRVTCL